MMTIPASIISAINRLDYDDLHVLYHSIVERLALLGKRRDLDALRKFSVLDYVSFSVDGVRKRGTIIRLNRKSATVMLDDGVRWNVSPHALAKVIGAVSPLKALADSG